MNVFVTLLCPVLVAFIAQDIHPPSGDNPKAIILNKAIERTLTKVIPLDFKAVPLGVVLKSVKAATASPTDKDPGIAIFVDPKELEASSLTIMSPITYQTEEDETLEETLRYMLGTRGLMYEVKGGLLRIVSRRDQGVLLDGRKIHRAMQARLNDPIPLHFKKTPLEDVLQYIKKSTQGPNDSGLRIYVDPVGLQEAEKTMSSPVSMDSKEKEPLRESLTRLLKPLGLAYNVKNGLLSITSLESLDVDLPVDAAKSKNVKPE